MRSFVLILGLSLLALTASAQTNPAPVTAEPPPSPSPLSVTGEPGKGVIITTTDNRLSMNIRGRVQLRTTAQELRGEVSQLTQIKTLRLYFQGHVLWPELKYVIQLAEGTGDFEEGSASPIFDAFIEHTYLRDLNIKIGQFFVPFDRARTVREFSLQMVDRPVWIPELTLDRDVGISFSSSDLFGLGGKLFYALSVFGGDGRNRTAISSPGLLYVGRLAVTPFGTFDDNSEGDLDRKSEPRLMIGVAGAYNHHTDRQRSTTGLRFAAGNNFNTFHGAADLVFKYAGLSVMAEGVVMDATVDSRDAGMDAMGNPVRDFSRSGWGYLFQAGMMLTDKIETVGRWSHQGRIGATTDAAHQTLLNRQAHELAFGANYYLNKHYFKFQFDLGLRWGEWENQKEHLARLQLDASF